jgi:hypothetical protein
MLLGFMLGLFGDGARDEPDTPADTADSGLTFVEIYRPVSQQEVIFLRMVLEREAVDFYIVNEGVYGLFHIPDSGLGTMRLMVDSRYADHCRKVLSEELGIGRSE